MTVRRGERRTLGQPSRLAEHAAVLHPQADDRRGAARGGERVVWLKGVIVFFLQIDTVTQKNSSRDKHLQNRLSETPCAFGAD
jgi:hypothetical protein